MKTSGIGRRQNASLTRRRGRRQSPTFPYLTRRHRTNLKIAAILLVLLSIVFFAPSAVLRLFQTEDQQHFSKVHSLRRLRRKVKAKSKTMNATSAVFGVDVPPIGVGFGTAALGGGVHTKRAVGWALEAGFRKFDTAEAEYWYDQKAVGQALKEFSIAKAQQQCDDDELCPSTMMGENDTVDCQKLDLRISTKIPPWQLTSSTNIREQASTSREQLLGFCKPIHYESKEHFQNPFLSLEDIEGTMSDSSVSYFSSTAYPIDTYYIHAPACWEGWHPRCDDVGPGDTLPLREAWLAMEAVVAIDHSAARIGLSNVHPPQLLDIIQFVKERKQNFSKRKQSTGDELQYPPPRMPDVLQAFADPFEPATELRRICQEQGIEFVSYSTLGTQHVMRQGGNFNPVLNNENIENIAKSYGSRSSTAEVVLRWALQKGMSVIPRSTKQHHIRQLARLLNYDRDRLDPHSPNSPTPNLTKDEIYIIDGLSRRN